LKKFRELLVDKLDPLELTEYSDWKDIKLHLKSDPRYKDLASVTLKEQLFEEFMVEFVLKNHGMKRNRMV
jgi:hypothetical protein